MDPLVFTTFSDRNQKVNYKLVVPITNRNNSCALEIRDSNDSVLKCVQSGENEFTLERNDGIGEYRFKVLLIDTSDEKSRKLYSERDLVVRVLETSPGPEEKDKWGFADDTYRLDLHVQPDGAIAEVQIYAGASFRILETTQINTTKWMRIQLGDGTQGWLNCGVREYFLRVDPRTFFQTMDKSPIRSGFLLLMDHTNKHGNLKSFEFDDSKMGIVEILIPRVKKIYINRRQKDSPVVRIQTDSKEYAGSFPPYQRGYKYSLYLILTRSFYYPYPGNLKDELDLRTIEYAELERIRSPHLEDG